MSEKPSKDELEGLFTEARDDINNSRDILKDGNLDQGQTALLQSSIFDSSLEGAGYARRASKRTDVVRELVSDAADAAVQMFRLRGTIESTTTEFPSGDVTTVDDTSLTSQWTLVQALYAALAGGNKEALEELAKLSPDKYHSDQVKVSEPVELFSSALKDAIAGQTARAKSCLVVLIDKYGSSKELDNRYWVAQAKVLLALIERDQTGVDQAFKELQTAFAKYYGGPEDRDNPEGFLELPILGLEALRQLWNGNEPKQNGAKRHD